MKNWISKVSWEKVLARLRGAIGGVFSSKLLIGIGGAFLGYLASDLSAYQESQRDALKADYDVTNETAVKLLDQLQMFSAVARGEREPTEKDRGEFSTSVSRLYHLAQRVSDRAPGTQRAFDIYSTALVDLQHEASRLKGPAEAKPFVETVGRYFVAEKAFNDKIIEYQKCFLCAYGLWSIDDGSDEAAKS